ncbi:hypothetical protein GALMADRAFT_812785 [Galerina marginata CBS 339.88]|uniref:Uncharacterized protein n=1 Tax=Galerina marginata (strain CBS 339.88) TaxID=685588 RepID=A0A067SIY0_GALM3|nr:hypothetical protein GALMADRAFT_812785 [Galerina marginata CBS 339.88]
MYACLSYHARASTDINHRPANLFIRLPNEPNPNAPPILQPPEPLLAQQSSVISIQPAAVVLHRICNRAADDNHLPALPHEPATRRSVGGGSPS